MDKAPSSCRDYTPDEVDAFPAWLWCCYVLQPFNHAGQFESIEQWAETLSPLSDTANAEDAKRLLSLLEHRISALQADARWIPVGERLPDESVLCALINFERHQSAQYGTQEAQCG